MSDEEDLGISLSNIFNYFLFFFLKKENRKEYKKINIGKNDNKVVKQKLIC
jgi:hypothetical protein